MQPTKIQELEDKLDSIKKEIEELKGKPADAEFKVGDLVIHNEEVDRAYTVVVTRPTEVIIKLNGQYFCYSPSSLRLATLQEIAAVKPAELVRSWEGAFDSKGYIVDSYSNILRENHLTKHGVNKHAFKTKAQAKSALAFAQLSHIVADANGDWVADWGNLNQDKHVIFSNPKYELETAKCYLVPVFLPMKSEEIAMACLEKHRTLWEDFWMISK